jgi:uncharacterized protein YjbI with pentapeptide repeats
VANPDHLELLQQGVDVWNAWRAKEPSIRPDLRGADLTAAKLGGADLRDANLREANTIAADLSRANLRRANLRKADLRGANLSGANLTEATLSGANLNETILIGANLTRAQLGRTNLLGAYLSRANLSGAGLGEANLRVADLSKANLTAANLSGADLSRANLRAAKLREANLSNANLSNANLSKANLSGANLTRAQLVETNLIDATLTGCGIYGISAWDVKLNKRTKQLGLIITPEGEPAVTVDDLELAQFVYLLLHNEKIRRVIDTVGKKGVLLLGRFTEGRIAVLERLRDELRQRGYLPIVFNFDKPETKDFTETVRLLAGLSKFVIADITNPKSAPLELQATVPEIMVPFRPIIEEGEKPFAMLQDLWSKHRDWVFEPIYYSSPDALIASLDEKIIRPAEARFVELVKRKADTMGGEHV